MPDLVSAQRFAVVDVETSGLRVQRHHVLQVGVVVVEAMAAGLPIIASTACGAALGQTSDGRAARVPGISSRQTC